MRDSSTKFPRQIDDRLFFNDTDLKHVELMQEYEKKLAKGDYAGASSVLNGGDNQTSYYGAWLNNLLGNQVNAIGTYLKNKCGYVYVNGRWSKDPNLDDLSSAKTILSNSIPTIQVQANGDVLCNKHKYLKSDIKARKNLPIWCSDLDI